MSIGCSHRGPLRTASIFTGCCRGCRPPCIRWQSGSAELCGDCFEFHTRAERSRRADIIIVLEPGWVYMACFIRFRRRFDNAIARRTRRRTPQAPVKKLMLAEGTCRRSGGFAHVGPGAPCAFPEDRVEGVRLRYEHSFAA